MQKPLPPDWLRISAPIAEAIVRHFHPCAEVGAHDRVSDRIVALWNPSSGRTVGEPALLSQLPESSGDLGVCVPCATVLQDGRNLTSVSAVPCDPLSAHRGLPSVNYDRSPLVGVVDLLARFVVPGTPRPPELRGLDWREQIALVVEEECRTRHRRRVRLTRAERLSLVELLNPQGLFATRQAASHASAALGVSRASVHALLKEITP